MRRRRFLELAGGGAAGAVLTATVASPARAAPAPFATVAGDGTGDFATVQAAIDSVPSGNTTPVTIAIKPARYLGQVKAPSSAPFITLVGLGHSPSAVVIADDRANGTPKPDGSG